MESISIREVNEILGNLDRYNTHNKSFVKRVDNSNYCGETWEEIHSTINPQIFLSIAKRDDSYGDYVGVIAVKFVKAVEKTITVYEYE